MLSIRHFFPVPEKGWLFDVMVNRLGLRTGLAERPQSETVIKRARERCADCGREDTCQAWMMENAQPETAPYFCRNHDMLERLKREVETEAVLNAA